MSLHETTIRFEPATITAGGREAAHQGLSFSEYVRGATVTRILVDWARRDPNSLNAYGALLDGSANLALYLELSARDNQRD